MTQGTFQFLKEKGKKKEKKENLLEKNIYL